MTVFARTNRDEADARWRAVADAEHNKAGEVVFVYRTMVEDLLEPHRVRRTA